MLLFYDIDEQDNGMLLYTEDSILTILFLNALKS